MPDKIGIGDDQFTTRNRGIIKPLQPRITDVEWRMAGRHEMDAFIAFAGFQTTPCGGATTGMDNIDMVRADNILQTGNIAPHCQGIFWNGLAVGYAHRLRV